MATGITPTYSPISENVAMNLGVIVRSGDRHRNLVLERGARRREQANVVRFAFHPGIRDAQRRPLEMAERFRMIRRKRPEGVVYLDLRDGHWIRAVVEHAKHRCRSVSSTTR